MKKVLVVLMVIMLSALSFAGGYKHHHNSDFFDDMEDFNPEEVRYMGYLEIGSLNLDLDSLNSRLEGAGHQTFKDNNLTIGFSSIGKYKRFVGIGESSFTIGLEDKDAVNKDYDTFFAGGSGMAKFGYDLVEREDVDIYPTVGLGFGINYLSMDQKGDIDFDDIMDDPGRGVKLTRFNLLLDFGVGMEKTFDFEDDGEINSFGLGISTGYTVGIPIGDWIRGEDPFSFNKADHGPDTSMSGPYIKFRIGFGGKGIKQDNCD